MSDVTYRCVASNCFWCYVFGVVVFGVFVFSCVFDLVLLGLSRWLKFDIGADTFSVFILFIECFGVWCYYDFRVRLQLYLDADIFSVFYSFRLSVFGVLVFLWMFFSVFDVLVF